MLTLFKNISFSRAPASPRGLTYLLKLEHIMDFVSDTHVLHPHTKNVKKQAIECIHKSSVFSNFKKNNV